jgi:hypothetical protein
MPSSKGATFADCALAFVTSSALPASSIQSIAETLTDNGAVIVEPAPDGSIRLDDVTHIIANSIDFDQYRDAQQLLIPVITSAWAFHSAAKGRQMPLRGFSPDPRLIFSKVMLTCADLPAVDKETIAGAVTALGGVETADLSRQTTHVCALSMDHPKCERARAQLPKVKIVLPHWFDDCFKLGHRIDEAPYLLPDPEILRKGPADPLPVPRPADNLRGAATPRPEGPPTPHAGADANGRQVSSRPALTVFARKAVMFASNLALTDRLRGIIGGLISDGGGRVVDDVDECDIMVCDHRDGADFVEASRQGKEVGNLAWLYHLITTNEWTSPYRRLLHYPTPRDGVPGFENLVISISNYGGEARTYVESLIRALGATCTRTMTAENTHLVTARNSGDKCTAAADWEVEMVNHIWLEESYASCAKLAFRPKHVHFPTRTNLGEVVGQTSFDPERLRELYFPDGVVKKSKARLKRGRGSKSEDRAMDVGGAEGESKQGGGEGRQEGGDGDDQEGEHSVADGNDAVQSEPARKTRGCAQAQKPAAAAAAAASADSSATPARPRRSLEKDAPDDPPPTGGRSAKAKAIASLHDIAPDVALYEREKKRGTRDGLWGGKRAADEMDIAIRRSSSPAAEGGAATEERPVKKMRPSLPPVEKRVVLTGFERWANQPTANTEERDKVGGFGGVGGPLTSRWLWGSWLVVVISG